MEEENSLDIGIDQTILEVNKNGAGLEYVNHVSNSFSIFIRNISKKNTIFFRNKKKLSAEECMKRGGLRASIMLDGMEIRVSTDKSRQGYFASESECREFKFKTEGWTVNGEQQKWEYVWELLPEECILEPGEQLQFQIYDVEAYVEEACLGEEAQMDIYVQYEEVDSLTRTEARNGNMQRTFFFQKKKPLKILDFFADMGAVQAGKTENVQWNITGADEGSLVNKQTGEKVDLVDLKGSILQLNVDQTTEFVLEIKDNEGNEDRRSLWIQTAQPLLKTWMLDRGGQKVFWDVQCVEELLWEAYPEKNKSSLQDRIRGSLMLSDIGETDHLTIFCQNTGRDFRSTIWIPNQKDHPILKQFRKTITYFYGYQLLEVIWELEEGNDMTLVCHDLERDFYWNVAVNQCKGSWEQVIPCPSDKIPTRDCKTPDQAPKEYMEIRLQCADFEIIF